MDEAATHSDLVLTPELDSYYNTTYAVVNMFRVAAGLADRITHVLKTDDDTYVRVSVLLETLQGLPATWLYAGKVWELRVNRNPKWR
jgi:predicted DCC family thiol-disulfide oxidoreductase YuxK